MSKKHKTPKLRKAKAVVMIGMPMYDGKICHQGMSSYTSAFVDCMRGDIVMAPEFAVGFSLVQYARSWIVHQFLSNPVFTHLMWIDSDLGFEANGIRRLIETGKDVIGGSYTTKSPTAPTYPFVACGPVEDGIQEVTSLPGGFLLMSRKAVQSLADASEEFIMEHGGQDHLVKHVCDLELITCDEDGQLRRRLLGEDYVMQVRLRSLGFKIYLMTDINFVHVGVNEWRGNVAKAYASEKQQGLKTMWHEDAWDRSPRLKTDKGLSDRLLVASEMDVPHPGLLSHIEPISADA